MKINAISIKVLSLALSLAFSQLSTAQVDPGAAITAADLTTPAVNFPPYLGPNANQTQLANYAWRMFIAATQQTTATVSSGAGRGVGDGIHNFIDTGNTLLFDAPLVFESFYHRTEAYPYYTGAKPASQVNQPPVYRTFFSAKPGSKIPPSSDCGNITVVPASGKVPCTFVSSSNIRYVNLDETTQIGQNFLYYKDYQNPQNPLGLIRFMAKVNAAEVSYANSWPGMTQNKNDKPSPAKPFIFPDGVVEVKTAWRKVHEMTDTDPYKYHWAFATYYTSQGEGLPPMPQTTVVALVGIHIIQKSPNYPYFIFSTFEHVDAVQQNANQIHNPGYETTYNNLSYQTPSGPQTASVFGAYNRNILSQPAQINTTTQYTLPAAGAVSQAFTPLQQPKTITQEVNDVNNAVNSLISGISARNVWANYRLKGVQAIPTSNEATPNFFLANIVIESSQPGIQLFKGVVAGPSADQANPPNHYFLNCRGDKGNTNCVYPSSTGIKPPPFTSYNNISTPPAPGQAVPAPTIQMGGCQGCHGNAQQAGQDFSFLASGVLGFGKPVESTPLDSLPAAAKAAIKRKMALIPKY